MTHEGLYHSPLHDPHAELGARFTEFGGWEMPVSFAGIRKEHRAVRERAGVFDVSHMGEVEVSGPDAEALVQRLTSNDVSSLSVGSAQYSMITDEAGVILDDTVVYRTGDASFLFVPNAGHDSQMAERWTDHRDAWGLDATVENVTDMYAMLAVQGPEAPGAVAAEVGDATALDALGRFEFEEATVAGVSCLVSRTGYTGEPGYELLVPWADAGVLWDAFVGPCEPCGLGARDTLRMEMGYLLSGQDFDPESNPRNPLEADVAFAVDLDTEFVGRDALVEVRDSGGPAERIAGFVLADRGVPRHGYPLLDGEGEPVGEVTSGTMSPTLGEPIGLGYLPVDLAEPGTRVGVAIRGEAKPAIVQTTPFIEGP